MFKRKFLPYYVAGIVLVVGTIVVLLFYPAQGIKKDEFKVYMVENGPVYQTIPAEGVVEPESEVLLNSPANSTVKRIIYEPGSRVKTGDIIVMLDQAPVIEEIENLKDQLEVKKNSLQKLQLQVRSKRLDLDYTIETKKLKIASIKSELTDQEELLEVGGVSSAKIEKTKQELVSAQKDLRMTREKNNIQLKQLRTEVKGLELQIQIQERKLENQEKLLNKMNVRAPSSGIVLKITKKAGEKVRADELLIQMSDLSSFKIIASIDEKNAEFVKTGKPIFGLIDNERLSGKVGSIRPVIEDNKVKFDVYLDNENHSKLIPNLKMDLLLVKSHKDSVLRLSKEVLSDRGRNQKVYVMEGDKAYVTQIQTGLIGDNYVEIVTGVEKGDKVITTEMASLRKANMIELQK